MHVKLTPNQLRIYNIIKEGRWSSIKEIAAEARMDEGYCGNIIQILGRKGLIEKIWIARENKNVRN